MPTDFIPFFPWLALIVGLVLGSFYTVCVSRFLSGESIVLPASHCPTCLTPLRWWENIPLLSYLILRGRCRSCKVVISWKYPALEAVSAAWACLIQECPQGAKRHSKEHA